MNDYWNDPPEQDEIPECCDNVMDVDDHGNCKCNTLEIKIKKHEEAIRCILAVTKDYNERHNDNLPISCMSAFIENAAKEIYK